MPPDGWRLISTAAASQGISITLMMFFSGEAAVLAQPRDQVDAGDEQHQRRQYDQPCAGGSFVSGAWSASRPLRCTCQLPASRLVVDVRPRAGRRCRGPDRTYIAAAAESGKIVRL